MATAAHYRPNIEIVSDAEHLAHRSVELLVADAERAIRTKDVFYTAISGGNTPRRFFELLGEMSSAKALVWEKIQLFWVDERLVGPDSPSSNYRLAADTFLPKVGIPRKNVHRVPTERSDFESAARRYEKTIRTVFGLSENQIPKFDLIFLGIGVEGHTGSLFPNTYAPFDTNDLACVVYMLDERLNRITLTHPVLRAASHLAVLVSGAEKADILREVLTSEPDEVRYPIHSLWPILDKITWLTDAKAAKLLKMP
jgi:6-phosphogluconolactonase